MLDLIEFFLVTGGMLSVGLFSFGGGMLCFYISHKSTEKIDAQRETQGN